MVLGCTYIHILLTCLHWFRRNNRKHSLRERMRNIRCMSPMYSYLHWEILKFAWFHKGFLSHGSNVSHESRIVIDISNTPCKRSELERTDSLFFSIENLNELKGLVRMSASWSLVLTNQTSMTPLATKSCTKCMSISTYLEREWRIGLTERYVAPRLSQRIIGRDCGSPISWSNDCNQMTSAAALAMTLYSASVLDHATAHCFFKLREMRFVPRKIQ